MSVKDELIKECCEDAKARTRESFKSKVAQHLANIRELTTRLDAAKEAFNKLEDIVADAVEL